MRLCLCLLWLFVRPTVLVRRLTSVMKSFLRKTVVLSLIAAIVGTQSIVSFSKTPRLTEEQRIVHVLNRLGFGPRPGDVERIKSIGLENYINQQLAPEKIADTMAENKTQELSALKLSTAELYEQYSQHAQLN